MSLEVIRSLNKLKPSDLPIDILMLRQKMNYLMKDIFPQEFYAYLLGAKNSDIASYYGIHLNTVTNRMKRYMTTYSEFYSKDELDIEELINFVTKLKTIANQKQLVEDTESEFIPVSSYKEVI